LTRGHCSSQTRTSTASSSRWWCLPRSTRLWRATALWSRWCVGTPCSGSQSSRSPWRGKRRLTTSGCRGSGASSSSSASAPSSTKVTATRWTRSSNATSSSPSKTPTNKYHHHSSTLFEHRSRPPPTIVVLGVELCHVCSVLRLKRTAVVF
jgi:hypothetical protein